MITNEHITVVSNSYKKSETRDKRPLGRDQVTPAPVWVPTQPPLVQSFTSIVGYADNFSHCLCNAMINNMGTKIIAVFLFIWESLFATCMSLDLMRLLILT